MVRGTAGFIVTALVMGGGLRAPAQDSFVGVRGRAWWADPGGEMKFTSSPPEATTIHPAGDLGISSPRVFYNITGYVNLGSTWRISADYLRGSYHGSATAGRPLVFDKSAFPAGAEVHSALDVQRFELFIDETIYPMSNGGGIYSSLGFIWADIGAQMSGAGTSSSDSVNGIFPILGFHADVPIFGGLRGIGRVSYTQLKIGNKSLHTYELEGGLGFFFGNHFAAEGGYRLWRCDLFNDAGSFRDREVDMTFVGPFVGLNLLF